MEPPHPGQYRGSNSKSNDVRQRIKFTAEFAAGVGHARDAAIQSIEENGEPDRDSGIIKMPWLSDASLQRLQDGVIARADVGGGEQRGQQIHSLTALLARRVRHSAGESAHGKPPSELFCVLVCPAPARLRCLSATGRRPIKLAPPFTRSPFFTVS